MLGFNGTTEAANMLNYIVIHAKYYIYSKKIKDKFDIDFYGFISYLKRKLYIISTYYSDNHPYLVTLRVLLEDI